MTKAKKWLRTVIRVGQRPHLKAIAHMPAWIRPVFFSIVACFVLGASMGSSDINREDRVKAAFLYNFAKFIDWPGNKPDQGFQFCIVGEKSLGLAMEAIAGKTVRGQVISVQRSSVYNQKSDCHLLFVSKSSGSSVKSFIDRLTRQGVVTVGEGEQFVRHGGMIGFTKKNKANAASGRVRVGFAINVDTVRRAGVQVSSELLKLATVVENGPKR